MKYKYVKDLMTKPAIYCDVKCTIKEVVHSMKNNKIGFLPITQNNLLVGVITDRDIIVRSYGLYKSSSRISKIMTSKNLFFVSSEDKIEDAAKIMSKNKIRRLVVLSDGKPIGVLTTKNLLKEPSLLKYVIDTYEDNKTLPQYSIFSNFNPHDSVKIDDYRL